MGATSTLEKLENDEASQATADQKTRAEAVARYRELVSDLHAGKESPKASAIVTAVDRTASQLARDVEKYLGRFELLSVAKTSAAAGAERAKAHERLNHFNGVEQPEALAELDRQKAELEEAARLSDKATKQSEEARRQLLEGASLELRAKVKGFDFKKQQLRAEVSELKCRAHELSLIAIQDEARARTAPARAGEQKKIAAGKRGKADALLALAASKEDPSPARKDLMVKAGEIEAEAQRLESLAKGQSAVAAGFTKRAVKKRREVSDLLDAARENDGPISDVQNEIDAVLEQAILPCPELDV